jgi:hypothetical protein
MARFYRLLTPMALIGMVFLAMLLLTATLVIVFALPLQSPVSSSLPTAVLNIIPAATVTPLPPTPTVTPLPSATPEVPPTPQPGEIGVGGYVQVSGTGLDGLRVRWEPGLGAKTLFVAIESEVFQVTDGPREVDGYTWWQLLSPSNAQAQGWAVVNYLVAIERP